jgi:hypothetical protein
VTFFSTVFLKFNWSSLITDQSNDKRSDFVDRHSTTASTMASTGRQSQLAFFSSLCPPPHQRQLRSFPASYDDAPLHLDSSVIADFWDVPDRLGRFRPGACISLSRRSAIAQNSTSATDTANRTPRPVSSSPRFHADPHKLLNKGLETRPFLPWSRLF